MSAMRLTVDSENTTGATRLYESVGMTSESVICAWERSLR
jgi:ribosomal protein S18 acetylase RimI-like enzyme